MDIFLGWIEGGERTYFLHPSVVSSIMIVVALSIFFVICGSKVKKADPSKPTTGLVFFLELFVTTIEAFIAEIMGKKYLKFGAYIGTLAAFLLTANLSGLIGLTPPTSDYNVTLALAIMTIVLMTVSGIKAKGVGSYIWDTFFGDIPWLMPLHLLGEIAKPVSLSFRLFGNILSGMIILAVVTESLDWFSIVAFPILNAYFDIFAGIIQTLIFCMLTMIWTKGAMEAEGE